MRVYALPRLLISLFKVKLISSLASILPPLSIVMLPLLPLVRLEVLICPFSVISPVVVVSCIFPLELLKPARLKLAPEAVIFPAIAIVSPVVILTEPAPLLSASAVSVREPMELEKLPKVLSVRSAIVMLLVAAKEIL